MLPKKSTANHHTAIKIEQSKGQHCTYTRQNDSIRPKAQASFCRQFSVLIRRSIVSMSRNLVKNYDKLNNTSIKSLADSENQTFF